MKKETYEDYLCRKWDEYIDEPDVWADVAGRFPERVDAIMKELFITGDDSVCKLFADYRDLRANEELKK